MDGPVKRCCTCRAERPLSEFNVRRSARDGRQSRCRSCSAQWYADNRDRHKANVAANRVLRRARNTARLVAYLLEHPCVDCGEADLRVLAFDHRDPADKQGNVGQLLADDAAWPRVLAEIAACEVRCANCHRIRTAVAAGWGRHHAELQRRAALAPEV